MRTWLLAFILLGATTALAQDITGGLNNAQQIIGGAGSGGGFNNPGTVVSGPGPPPPVASFLLIQPGSIMLIQTGSKLEIHS